ncbi:MAG: hypothetical protein IJD04_04675 [Desulfovibrionaceae bacterium]|nr:hypothetical protein [Desulfovibrionaceae bacterium]
MSVIFDQQSTAFSIGRAYGNSKIFNGEYKTDKNLGTAGVFAADIVDRIRNSRSARLESADIDSNEAAYKDLGRAAPRSNKNLDGLQTSLENTINAIASRHGAQAANEVMNIVYQNIGSDVGEESLGQGFVNAIRFIDRNFGIDQGNQLMSELNSGVNKEINSYFNNGNEEVFFNAASPSSALRTAKAFMKQTDGMFDKAFENAGADIPAAITDPEEMEEMMLEAQAKRMLARGEIPPAYLQEYLPDNVMMPLGSGAMLDAMV